MTTKSAAPEAEVAIDAPLVAALLADQHPDLATLPLGERHEGWDNVTWRLGESLAVRLPRRALAATLLPMELEWLPRISTDWTFLAPVPVCIGEPGHGYPWRWSVVHWVEGTPLYQSGLNEQGVAEFGEALRAVHVPAPAGAPRNPFRGRTLRERREAAVARLNRIENDAPAGWIADSKAAMAIFDKGAAETRGALTWTHLDLHGFNVVSKNGRLAGILDWGDAGAGDPAGDLGQAMVLLPKQQWQTLIHAYRGVDEQTRVRADAEALSYALTLADIDEPHRSAGWHALESLGVAHRTR